MKNECRYLFSRSDCRQRKQKGERQNQRMGISRGTMPRLCRTSANWKTGEKLGLVGQRRGTKVRGDPALIRESAMRLVCVGCWCSFQVWPCLRTR